MKKKILSLLSVLLLVLSLCTAASAINGDRSRPALAYSANTNKYLAVYQKIVNDLTSDSDIYGQFIAADGTAQGSEFVISDASKAQVAPSIAYDDTNQRFMVVWQDRNIDSNYDIYGRLVNTDGSLFGSSAQIAHAILSLNSGTVNAEEHNPAVAYDSTDHLFLVSWERTRVSGGNATSYWDLYGQFVDASGTLNGSNFAIAENWSYMNSRLVFDSSNKRFLVAFLSVDTGPTFDIYGRLVKPDGTFVGAEVFPISVIAGSNQYLKGIAFDPVNTRFLVSWEDDRNPTSLQDIYGQLINADSTLNGTEIAISTVSNTQAFPVTAFDGVNRRYLVAWHDIRGTDLDIYGQYLNADGSLYNTDALTNVDISTGSGSQTFPFVACNSVCGNCVVASEDHAASPAVIGYTRLGNACSDTMPPSVSTTTPADADTGIALNALINAVFSEPMNASTINSTNFKVNNGAVSGVVSYNSANRTATFTPSENLVSDAIYTAAVTTGVKDIAGNSLTADYIWSFTTGSSVAANNPSSAPVLVSPEDGQTGLGTTVTFKWKISSDPDGDAVIYHFYNCMDNTFTGCTPVDLAQTKKSLLFAGGGILFFGFVFAARCRKGRLLLLLIFCTIVAGSLGSCKSSRNDNYLFPANTDHDTVVHRESNLTTGTTYYWKVVADDGKGGQAESATWSFTTQ